MFTLPRTVRALLRAGLIHPLAIREFLGDCTDDARTTIRRID